MQKQTTMHTLYISYDGMTDPLGQSQVIPYLIGLSKNGYQITLISCEKQERFQKIGETIKNLLTQNNIHWIPVPYSSLPSVLSKQLNLYLIQQKAEQVLKNQQPKIVHCRSYMASLIALKLKKKYGIKFIFDMRGFWADERIEGKIWSLNNPIHKRMYRFFKKKEIEFLQNANYTISLTQNAKDEILSWEEFKNQPIPIEVIPCCADLDLFSKKNIQSNAIKQLKEKLNISDSDFILSYLGSIGTWYMLDEMLDFFVELCKVKPNAKFLFVTPDAENTIINKSKQKNIDTNRIIIRSANRNEVPLYISLSNFSIYFIKPVFSKKASSATKTAEIMGMKIPSIANTGIGDTDAILKESTGGILISDFTIDNYQKAIAQMDSILESDKEKIRETAIKYYSLEKGVERYLKVYKTILP